MPFDVEGWRRAHREEGGETYRWRKAFACPHANPKTGLNSRNCELCNGTGWTYEEQTVDDESRMRVHGTTQRIVDVDYGLIETGVLRVSVMPDEAYLQRNDEVILTDPARAVVRKEAATRTTGSDYDALTYAPVVEIVALRGPEGEEYTAETDYELDADRVHWLSGSKPADGATYSREYTYLPTYIFLGSDTTLPRPGRDSAAMPLRGTMILKRP